MTTTRQKSNRAEDLRKRREGRSRKTSRSSVFRKGKKSKTAAPPPVLVRGAKRATPVWDSKKKKPIKRRYDVALSTPGAEIRLPSIPKVRIGWRILSALLVGVFGYLLYTYSSSPVFRVGAAEVEGLKRISQHDINLIANVSEQPIFTIDPGEVENNIREAFFDLSDVSVMVTLPYTVTVVVEERLPILVWRQEGQTMWIDSSGVAFLPRGETSPSIVVEALDALPVAAPSSDIGLLPEDEPSRFLPSHLVSAILAMSLHAPSGTPLFYTEDHGLGWKDSQGWEVYFGTDFNDIEMKLNVYDAIVNYLNQEDIHPELISVEFVHSPYYRLERQN